MAGRPRTILLGGVPRAGKTTLARRLAAATGRSIVPADALVSTLGALFPEHGVTHHGEDQAATRRAFRPVLREYLRHLAYEDIPFIVDVHPVEPAAVAELDVDALFLGYPGADPAAKRARIRRDERPGDWTAGLTDADLDALITRFVRESADLRDACARHAVPFVDTSTDFDAEIDAALRRLTPSG